MERDTLAEVIRAEKEIQGRLEAERGEAGRWLEQARKDAEEEVLKAKEALKEELDRAALKAGEEAREKAAGILKEAALSAQRLGGLGEEALESLARRHINRILPGHDHDSKDVKG